MIRTVKSGETVIAIIIPHTFSREGITFFTPEDSSQQLAFMKHSKGKVIEPHIHAPLERKVLYTKEVLLIRSGRLRVDLFTDAQEYLSSEVLAAGDVIMLAAGGHGFEVLEDAEFFEVKQGPYARENDKVRFQPPSGSREH
jgi:mannose-6-phosphate isomerase-like protein (cupin superfamily)